ncbi:MAG: hypothetical protein HY760_01155 [Nitrospirae bacterium]|nr:hypothetical protein [Nitrospirota bacterium]
MDILEKIKEMDCFLKNVTARRSDDSGSPLRRVEMKRDVSHTLDLPKKTSDRFVISVVDRISFIPNHGPFQIEVEIGATVTLNEALRPREIARLLDNRKNLLSLINQCLPYSATLIAQITDQMGFSPVIFTPRISTGASAGVQGALP